MLIGKCPDIDHLKSNCNVINKFTRIVSTDNIYKGLSSFAYELVELKAILKRSGKNTLVLADEVCKGTEHKSALIIVSTMIKMLIDCQTSFISATHLHELIKIDEIKKLENLKVFHLSVNYDDDKIIFERVLREGNGREEYGLDFAKFIISDDKFVKISNKIKNDFENKDMIISTKKSKYNTEVYMNKCDICECKDNLETHHIEFQKDCDSEGFILCKKHIHKNHKSNLVVLCEKCHDKIHNNKIIIKGYEETMNGNKLIYEISEKSNKKLSKFSEDIVNFIKKTKIENNKISQRKMKNMVKNQHNITISTSSIARIWKKLKKLKYT